MRLYKWQNLHLCYQTCMHKDKYQGTTSDATILLLVSCCFWAAAQKEPMMYASTDGGNFSAVSVLSLLKQDLWTLNQVQGYSI